MEMKGEIYRISGPVVTIQGINTRMYDVVKVGEEGLMGEVIGIEGDKSIVQVYEETAGIRPGEPVENTGMPLSVELGPGLLESIYDGIQRSLPILKDKMGDFMGNSVHWREVHFYLHCFNIQNNNWFLIRYCNPIPLFLKIFLFYNFPEV